MPKVMCAASDCKWNDVNNRYRAKEIHLNDMSIMTMWEGRQHLWGCKQYEKSEEVEQFEEQFKRMMKHE